MRIPLAALLTTLLLATATRAEDKAPLVVELFTSQGCSSCPPADRYVAELAEREGVLALSFHVDYWDYIGWKDPFSSPENTRRQRAYANRFHLRYVYTPQVVIDGVSQFTGSDRDAIETALASHAKHRPQLPLALERDTGGLVATLPQVWECAACDLWLVAFDREHMTPIKRGENAGKTLTNRNVVRELRHLGTWHGEARSIPVPTPQQGEVAAVLLQTQATGQIVAAATLPLGGD